MDLELQIRRLVWYQQLAKDIQNHICVLMAIFGRLGCETCNTVDAAGRILQTANPWAKQFLADIQCFQKIDAGQALLDLLDDRVLLVFTIFLPEFLAIDMSELRRTFDPICIPPPGWGAPESPIAAVELDTPESDLVFICDRSLADGTPCRQAFSTLQALEAHKSSAKGGSHGDISQIALLAITNACPFCKNAFSSKMPARNHIRRSLQTGGCGGSGSHVYSQVETPVDISCKVCQEFFDDVHLLLDRVAGHVDFPRPEAENRQE